MLASWTAFPKRRAGAHLEVAPDGSGTILAPDGAVHVLNDTAVALWHLCDGATSTDEMVEAVCELFRADAAVVRHDLDRILASLHAAGLIDWERRGADDG